MSAWPRLIASVAAPLAISLAALLGAPSIASAQSGTPAERAAQLASEGKGLSAENKHAEASEKFRQAIVLSPEGKYYMYLCISLSRDGKLGDALYACDAVERNGADAKTLEKTKGIIETLRKNMKDQGMDPDKALADGRAQEQAAEKTPESGGGGEGGTGSSAVGVPPALPQYNGAPPSVYSVPIVPHKYTWSAGATLFGAASTFGRDDQYGAAAAGFLLHADYMLVPQLQFGVQAYLGYTTIAANTAPDALDVADLGVAAYKHFCFGRACITPLLGLHVAGLQRANDVSDDVSMVAVGARGEGTLSVALGGHYEHVLSASLGMNGYSAAIGDYATEPELFGVDKPSSTTYFGLGYTYRFNTPIGRAPFITFD